MPDCKLDSSSSSNSLFLELLYIPDEFIFCVYGWYNTSLLGVHLITMYLLSKDLIFSKNTTNTSCTISSASEDRSGCEELIKYLLSSNIIEDGKNEKHTTINSSNK